MPRRVFQVPQTRLPFVNGEIARVNLNGKPHLASAVWGDIAGGRIYFWNPLTGEHAMRMPPKGVPGIYMLQTASDGRMYLGDGNGDLHRYDPAADKIETLVKGQMDSITWGGCVTDRYVIWTASPGDACVYDWRADKFVKKFSPIDPAKIPSHYGHNAIEAPDGKILIIMDVPQAHIVALNPADMTVQSLIPESIVGQKNLTNACFFQPNSLMIVTENDCQILSYPQLGLVVKIGLPKGFVSAGAKVCLVGDFYYALLNGGKTRSLFRIGGGLARIELVAADWIGEDTGYLGAFERKYVCAISVSGTAYCFDPSTNKTTTMNVENLGQMPVHAMGVGPEMETIVGAPFINARFWTIDLKTGEGKDQGRGMPGAGQINQVLWDAGRHKALMTSYTEAAVMEFDPTQPAHWPTNPHIVATAQSEQQMRPWEAVFDRRFVWMATGAGYGLLGGALSRIDLESNTIKIWRNIIPDQTINALVLDLKRRRLYFSSHIYADGESAPPTQTTAQIGCFDIDQLKPIRIQKWNDGVPAIGVVCMQPDGKVLVHEGPEFYSWDALTGDVKHMGRLQGLGDVAVDDNGTIWASFGDATGRLEVGDGVLQFVKLMDGRARQMQIVDSNMYYTVGLEIHEIPLDELRAMKAQA